MRALLILCLVATHASADDPRCDPGRTYCFELQLHVAPVGDKPAVTSEWIATQVATANRHFAALDVGFQVRGTAKLPASAAHLRTRADRSALAPHVSGQVIHVFVTGQLDNVDDDTPVYGVTWRTGKRKFVILGANAFDVVLAHELGHVFGLPHSTYAISIMNKTKRDLPPFADRRFADEEVSAMRRAVRRLTRTKVLENVRYDAEDDR